VPDLRFAYDESIERGARVEDILRRLNEGEEFKDEEEDA
jgi:ribosome-binding factor A